MYATCLRNFTSAIETCLSPFENSQIFLPGGSPDICYEFHVAVPVLKITNSKYIFLSLLFSVVLCVALLCSIILPLFIIKIEILV